ncbi:hypothetical protein SEA_SOYO_49 [Mycobacterium phage SoYo]|uniref:Uncharacterized protein n=22 Tax=Microwolfvirus TaxID=2942894 RepID=A0A0A7RY40_9CAUD|nr:hypothetical protein AVT20_gp50 [Mycobacterium phage Tiffany]YP_009198474.1 hypothetical protein AVV34_gp51 [Mycobacterium phage MarQuardt]YP_009219111.1 hypothetical protein AVV42_gp53 [Mycobacterium phage Anubis]YP_009635639.1 hypothetical protein FGG58_gp46 [Mycobacterium phage JHC117]AEK07711.1 hypothetical protein VIX_49 [Mycobacterium phage Vix]AJA43437.1 hypothetical protein PBI_TAURUS_50 [Mycobacterium phage Taurus]ALF01014.1 hypothetical protein SEA_WOOLDRI_51 [Mycobacterium phage
MDTHIINALGRILVSPPEQPVQMAVAFMATWDSLVDAGEDQTASAADLFKKFAATFTELQSL